MNNCDLSLHNIDIFSVPFEVFILYYWFMYLLVFRFPFSSPLHPSDLNFSSKRHISQLMKHMPFCPSNLTHLLLFFSRKYSIINANLKLINTKIHSFYSIGIHLRRYATIWIKGHLFHTCQPSQKNFCLFLIFEFLPFQFSNQM